MFLVDTHILIWALSEPQKLPAAIAKLLSSDAKLFISSVSLWEISLKYALGKLPLKQGLLPKDIPTVLNETNVALVAPTIETIASFYELPVVAHRDPFDRMIVWQAISEEYELVTVDNSFVEYKKLGLKIFDEKRRF